MRVIAFFICTAALYAQTDWPVYGGNLGNTRYSPLNQIDTTNVAKLAQAWIFDTKPPASAKSNRQIEVTPLVVNGVMYLVTAYQSLVALDPETGQQIWAFNHKHLGRPPRGVGYWPGDKDNPPEILFGTFDGFRCGLADGAGVQKQAQHRSWYFDSDGSFSGRHKHSRLGVANHR